MRKPVISSEIGPKFDGVPTTSRGFSSIVPRKSKWLIARLINIRQMCQRVMCGIIDKTKMNEAQTLA